MLLDVAQYFQIFYIIVKYCEIFHYIFKYQQIFFNLFKYYLIQSNGVNSTMRYHKCFMNFVEYCHILMPDIVQYCQMLCFKGLSCFFHGIFKNFQGCFKKYFWVTSCLFQVGAYILNICQCFLRKTSMLFGWFFKYPNIVFKFAIFVSC